MATYGERLEAALKRAGVSRRALAARMAEVMGTKLESERKSLYAYRDGATPEPARAAVISEVLADPSLRVSSRRARRDRLAEVEDQVNTLKKALHVAALAHDELKQRVEALEARPADRQAAPTTPRARRGK